MSHSNQDRFFYIALVISIAASALIAKVSVLAAGVTA